MRLFVMALLAVGTVPLVDSAVSAQAEKPVVFPAVPGADAWAKLPPQKTPPLPEWARALAGPLPKTAAKMLELDYLQREKNPLGPLMSANVRLAVAEALGSKYGVAVARADADRALESSPLLPDIKGGELAMAFAKKLTLEGHAITDKEFVEVLKYFGPEGTTALVHTVAYANFHNRVLLGLGVKGESPALPPVAVQFDLEAAKLTAPVRPPWDDLKAVKESGLSVKLDWSAGDAEAMAKKLDQQKERTLRIPMPSEHRLKQLPPRELDAARRILWNTVSSGYQPEMTRAWFACLSAWYEEAKPDRVFTNSAFWVVTRTNDCFY